MPSFQPRNGFATEVSTIAGRTIAIGRPAPCFAISDSARLLVKRVSIRPAQLLGAPRAFFGQIILQPANPVLADLILQRLPAQPFRRMFLLQRLLSSVPR
jgi:hypothetical protein